MSADRVHESADPEAIRRHAAQRESAAPGHDSDPAGAGLALLRTPAIGGRGNGPVRAAALQRMQQTQGNRAVQRALAGPTPVQREDPPGAPAGTQPAGQGGGASNPGGLATLEGASVRISGGMVDVAAPFVRVAGVLQADTLITNSVISSSYTPGAGNVA
jgi:hypothetical protein